MYIMHIASDNYIEVVCLILLKLNNSRFSKNKLIQLTILRTIQKSILRIKVTIHTTN